LFDALRCVSGKAMLFRFASAGTRAIRGETQKKVRHGTGFWAGSKRARQQPVGEKQGARQ